MGTVGYMAPEQVRGETADAATDMFALGCTMLEMLTGERPFVRATAADSLAALLNEPAPNLLLLGLAGPAAARGRRGPLPREGPRPAVLVRARSRGGAARAADRLRRDARRPSRRRRARMRSLAVLPFVNAGGETEADYLSDGITESIINSLSQLPKLRVDPRSTVFAYKGVAVNPRSVGLALNVDSLVTGRVMQQGPLLNIQAELVDVATETQVWGDQYRHPGLGADLAAGADRVADLGGAAHPPVRARRRSASASARPAAATPTRSTSAGATSGASGARRGSARRSGTSRRPSGSIRSTRARTPGSPRPTASWATTATCRPTSR